MNEVTKVDESTAVVYQPQRPLAVVDPYDSLIARAATDPNFDIDKFERLLEAKERNDLRVAERAFHADLAEARKEIKPVVKNRTVNFQTSKGVTNYEHEDLASVQTAVDKILADHGFSYYWKTKSVPNEPIEVTCVVTHRLGHSISNTLTGPRDESGSKNAIQQIGSSLTYLERYSLKAALGLAAAKDNDGQTIQDSSVVNDVQLKTIHTKIVESGSDEKRFLEYLKAQLGVEKFEDIPAVKYDAVCKKLDQAKAAKEALAAAEKEAGVEPVKDKAAPKSKKGAAE